MATKKIPDPTFTKAELIASAHVFDTRPEIMAGALYDVKDPLTKAEAANKLAVFLKKPIGGK